MKNIYGLFFTALSLLAMVSFNTNAQTNVSGGIYSNTTWTKVNSPYIITDTVVVFPGVTLTIEPGVTVKFADSIDLEIRQATLIALGTKTDSITFTSNSKSPSPGIYNGVIFNINGSIPSQFAYCNFYYAEGLQITGNVSLVKNSNFKYNLIGAEGYSALIDSCNFYNNLDGGLYLSGGHVENCTFYKDGNYGIWGLGGNFKNCKIYDNQTGIISGGDTLQNCLITNNNLGIDLSFEGLSGYEIINSCTVNKNKTGVSDDINPFYGGTTIMKNCEIDSNNERGVVIYSYDTLRSCEIKNSAIGVIINGYAYGAEIVSSVIENDSIGIIDSIVGTTIYCNKICNNKTYDFMYGGDYTTNIQIPNNYWCTTDSATVAAEVYDGYDNISLGLAHFMPLDTQQCYLTGCNLQLSYTSVSATCDTCHTGSATVNVTNGVSPFIYTWYSSPIQTKQTATNLAPGTYTVCVVDANGCSACYNSVFVDSTNCNGFAITANGNNATCNTCNDGEAWVNVIGGTPPYSYTWYTSPFQSTDTAVALGQGQYSVCVSDKYNCAVCDSVLIGVGNCSAHFELYPDTMPHSYLAKNMASGVAPITFVWNWGDGTSDTAAYPSHTYASPGTYTICLTITDAVGCTNTYCVSYYLKNGNSTMVHVTVVSPNGIPTNDNELKMENGEWRIYPNPASNSLNIVFVRNQKSIIKILSLLGEEVYSSTIAGQETAIDISNLTSGVYMIEAVTGSKVSRQKFVKTN